MLLIMRREIKTLILLFLIPPLPMPFRIPFLTVLLILVKPQRSILSPSFLNSLLLDCDDDDGDDDDRDDDDLDLGSFILYLLLFSSPFLN